MRKRILAVMLCCFMAVGVCACDKTTDTVKETKDQQEINQKTFNKSIEAFKEFYSDFYEEHRDADAIVDGICWDCQARIIIDNENTPLMAICDFIVSGDEVSPDIYLFEYNGEEVVKKASINGMLWDSDDGFTIYCIEDEIYVGDIDGTYAYRVEDEYFIQLDTEYFDEEKNIKGFVTGLGENGLGASYLLNDSLDVRGTDFIYSERALGKDINMSGTDFELFLKNMMEADIQNDLDLRFYYADYYLEKGFIDEKSDYDAGVLTWEGGIYYRLYEDGTATVLGVDTGYENVSIPDSVMGYVVNKVGCTYTGYDSEFGEIEEIAYFLVSDATTVIIPQSVSDVYIEGTESIIVLEGTVNVCIKNGKVKYLQIPDSVTKLDINADNVSIIFCNEGSYAQQYAEDNGIPYVIGTIEYNKNDTPIIPLSYTIENEVLPAYQEYIDDNGLSNNTEKALIYLDNDDIPELLIYRSEDYYGYLNIYLLSYFSGMVYLNQIETDYGYLSEIMYIEKGNKLRSSNMATAGASIEIKLSSISEGKMTVDTVLLMDTVTQQYDDDDIFYVNDSPVSEQDFDNALDQNFDFANAISPTMYNSLSEAYENLGKETFATAEEYVTKFELVDGVLTVEAEESENGYLSAISISYPISDDCSWEDCVFGEYNKELSYEELKSEIEEQRNWHLRYLNGEIEEDVNDPYSLYIEIKDGEVIRVYNNHV